MYSAAAHGRTAGPPKYPNPLGNSASYVPGHYPTHGQMYAQGHTAHIQPENNGASVDNLSHNFVAMNLRAIDSANAGRLKENILPANLVNLNGMYGGQANGQLLYSLPDGSLVFSGMNNYQQYPAYSMAPAQSAHLQQAPYGGFTASGTQAIPSTPLAQTWIPSQSLPHEVPGLVAPRRNSWSSSEETGPHTPIYSIPNQVGYQTAPLFNDHSPATWNTTPSPHQVDQSYGAHLVGKDRNGNPTYMDFKAIALQEPPIPVAIPAPRTPNDGRGTLDKIFDNPHKTTNVYIRGLHPNTTDAMLEQYGARFGDIVTAKSIIDHPRSLCKGYGFIMYHNYVDAENCIRGFFFRGYEAKFAKPSHNSRLKTLSRADNTNLYVSNLPKNMNDAELCAIFTAVNPEFNVVSHKVLKDSLGMSRGVGFARFETPEICEKVIQTLHGKPVGEGKDSALLQLRYADTKEQKQLKMETAERRQFKAEEYNFAAFGPASPYGLQSPMEGIFPSPTQVRVPTYFMGQSPATPLAQCVPVQSGVKVQISAPPPPTLTPYPPNMKIKGPDADADTDADTNANPTTETNTPSDSDEEEEPVCNVVPEAPDLLTSPTKSKL